MQCADKNDTFSVQKAAFDSSETLNDKNEYYVIA